MHLLNPFIRAVFLGVSFLCFVTGLYAGKKEDTSAFHSQLFLKTTPLSIIDRWGAIMPVGIEYNFLKPLSVIGEVGVPLFSFVPAAKNTETRIKSDFKLRGEIRCYINFYNDETNDGSLFIGADFFYRHQKLYQTGDEAYFQLRFYDKTETYYFTAGSVSKDVWGAGFLIGGSSHCSKRMLLECYTGFGWQKIHANREKLQIAKMTSYESGYWSPGQNHVAGEVTKIYLPFGIKVAYQLHKK